MLINCDLSTLQGIGDWFVGYQATDRNADIVDLTHQNKFYQDLNHKTKINGRWKCTPQCHEDYHNSADECKNTETDKNKG